jgi:hypothetical protein
MIPLPPKGPAAPRATGRGGTGPSGRWTDAEAADNPFLTEPTGLRLPTLLCTYCEAGPDNGQTRTVAASAGSLTVTWHLLSCPHYAADRILAGKED